MPNPKILVLDIETAPNKVYVWGAYDQNISPIQVIQPGYMLCWSAKWLGNRNIMFDSIVNYPEYFKKHPANDLNIAKSLKALLDQADIIIAHNGKDFDIKWANTLFLRHKLGPAAPFKVIDTLKEAKSCFKFPINKLEYLVQTLNIGEKMKHEGFSLWIRCMEGDPIAWKHMENYNKKDIVILEELYNLIKPYMKNPPKLGLYYDDNRPRCNKCGNGFLRKRGFFYSSSNRFQTYVCTSCKAYNRSQTPELIKEQKDRLLGNC